jgi:hydroxymethylglutaryl-CoA reductase
VVTKFNELRKPIIDWIQFFNIDEIRKRLSTLKPAKKPVFGKMNAQQMIEHLSFLIQISNGKVHADFFVEDEKSARRRPFLDTEGELQVGFKAPMLSEEPTPVKFKTIKESIDDLVIQITEFGHHFKTAKTENHPFFGELDFEYWQKFHVKHCTHHFKQFEL